MNVAPVSPARTFGRALLRTVTGLVVAIVVTFLLLVAVEMFSAIVHPFPPGFKGTKEEMCAHVAKYPNWVLAAVVPMWSAIAFIGTSLAGRLGHRISSILVALLLTAAVLSNIAMLPYPRWFQIVQPIAVVLAISLALRRPQLQNSVGIEHHA